MYIPHEVLFNFIFWVKYVNYTKHIGHPVPETFKRNVVYFENKPVKTRNKPKRSRIFDDDFFFHIFKKR